MTCTGSKRSKKSGAWQSLQIAKCDDLHQNYKLKKETLNTAKCSYDNFRSWEID